ncbi:MAG: hypothetical protein ABFS17_08905 [Chloroflexota bacterium]
MSTQDNLPTPPLINHVAARRFGIGITLFGLVVFLIGAVPQWFGLDNSSAVGPMQVGVFSIGLVMITFGGTLTLGSLWPPYWRSISADIGSRLAWTGLVIALAASLADIFGLGTRPLAYTTTFFGYWQARGVLIGQLVIGIGLLLMIPFKGSFPPPPEIEEEIPELPKIEIAAD